MEDIHFSSSLGIAVSVLHKELRKHTQIVQSYSMTEMETIGHLLKAPSLLPSELAVLTRVKTQSMSQILNKLEEDNIIKRTPSKEDKRKTDISITAFGRKMVEKTMNERHEWLNTQIEKKLNAKEKEVLAKAIPILNKLLDIR